MSENSNVPILDNERIREVVKEGLDAKLWTAFSKAQGQFRTPKLNRTAKVMKEGRLLYETHYADLEEIIDCIRKPLSENGLSFVQKTVLDHGTWFLVLQLRHELGGFDESVLPIAVNQTNQQLGSTLTYLKRYQASAYFGLAADFDDDANGAAGNEAQFGDGKKSKQEAKYEKPKSTPISKTVGEKESTYKNPEPKVTEAKVTIPESNPANFILKSSEKDVDGKRIGDIPESKLREILAITEEKLKITPPQKNHQLFFDTNQNIKAFFKSMDLPL